MNSKIVVSANCYSGVLAIAFQAIMPEYSVVPAPIFGPEHFDSLYEALSGASVWFTVAEHLALVSDKPEYNSLKIIQVPNIVFPAFHPDLTAATNRTTNQLFSVHYHSRIGIWAYNNLIDSADAASLLFNNEVFKELGYYDLWEKSVKNLKLDFINAGIGLERFKIFFRKIKRRGIFMHSTNHPVPFVLAELAKILVIPMSPQSQAVEREIFLLDGLSAYIWPVYPEIGFQLGVEGGYVWRWENREFIGIKSYLDFLFSTYAQEGAGPGDLAVQLTPRMHAILSAQVKK